MTRNQYVYAGSILAALLLAGGIYWGIAGNDFKLGPDHSKTAKPETTAEPKEQKPKETAAPTLIIGDRSAPQTIIEYGDFQCQICKRFFTQTEPTLINEYLDTKKAKIEFRPVTQIGQESVLAANAAYCANEQGKFKQLHDELYKRQGSPESGVFSAENLKIIGGKLVLNRSKFENCIDGQKYLKYVTASNEEAKQRGVTSTPTFYIDGQKITGAQPISIFRSILGE